MGERLENDRNEVLEANRIYHRLLADSYDAEQTFVSHAYIQKFFLNDLDSILGGLQDRQRPLRILDCGAGTGNLTLKFLERGCHVTATDISPEMLNELKKKINPAHLSRFECHVQDIDSFLQGATENYDVVCSSSFLHHLPNYKETYRWMLRRCAPWGKVYTAYEPRSDRRQSLVQNLLIRTDETLYNFHIRRLYNPLVVGSKIVSKLTGKKSSAPNPYSLVDVKKVEDAEAGVDAQLLHSIAIEEGFPHFIHSYRCARRYKYTQWLDETFFASSHVLFAIASQSEDCQLA